MVSEINILPEYSREDAYRSLREFSHIWIIFLFHQSLNKEWHETVRPPRLGGNARVGVFASRSPFRPNPIGISAVELLDLEFSEGQCRMHIRGADLVDGTPVLDIKPYIPYSDCIAAKSGYALQPELKMAVDFTRGVQDQLQAHQQRLDQPLINILSEMLAYDPRPAYRADKDEQAEYGVRLFDLNIRFRVEESRVTVFDIDQRD